MNRTWSEFFGTGISKALEDLGSQGEWPSHPELLDWLAAEFMDPQYDAAGTHPWDIRHMVRIIVLSNTYRQSSHPLLSSISAIRKTVCWRGRAASVWMPNRCTT